MITKAQAEKLTHGDQLYFLDKDQKRVLRCRVSGKLKTWKTRPNDWKLPVKYGLYENAYIGTTSECEDAARFYLTEAELEPFLAPTLKGRIGTKAQRAALEQNLLERG